MPTGHPVTVPVRRGDLSYLLSRAVKAVRTPAAYGGDVRRLVRRYAPTLTADGRASVRAAIERGLAATDPGARFPRTDEPAWRACLAALTRRGGR